MSQREREMRYFHLLSPEDMRASIVRLALSGMSDTTIAAATALSVEQVRRVIAEQNETAKGSSRGY
jgi:hypothetical protein